MALYRKKILDNDSTLLIWKIEEEYDSLFEGLELKEESIERISTFGSEQRKKEFLATRKLLAESGFSDFDLSYTEDGAPLLKDQFISISHTKEYVAILLGENRVGVDIERNRSQIFRIAHKFVNTEEEKKFDVKSLEVLSIIWNAKEALFKLCERKGIDFRENMNVDKIDFSNSTVEAELVFDDFNVKVTGILDIFDNHTLVCLMND